MTLYLNEIEIITLASSVIILVVQIIISVRIYLRPARYLRKIKQDKIQYTSSLPTASIIIYARDEAYYMEKYLPQILNQDYPDYEVIVVNDGLTEECQDLILQYQVKHPNLHQTFVPPDARNISRRKLALSLGAKAAKNEVIVLTEANCEPASDQWLRNMCRHFLPETDIVLGYSHLTTKEKSGAWYRVYDRLSFAGRYFSYAIKGKTYMGEGSNIAYRKEMFLKSRNFSRYLNLHIGDDDMFVNENATPTNVRVEYEGESQMTAYYDKEKYAWRNIKKRYAYTGHLLKKSPRGTQFIDFFTRYLFYISIAGLSFLGIYNYLLFIPAGILLLTKTGISFYVFHKLKKTFGEEQSLCLLPIYNLVQWPVDVYFLNKGMQLKNKYITSKIGR